MNTKYMMAALAAGVLCACVPGGIAMNGGEETRGDTSDETGDGDGDGLSAWSEIRCVDSVVEVCYGRLDTATDAWTIVVQDCFLDDMIASGAAEDVPGWTSESCNAGDHPSGMLPEWRCLAIFDREITVCYAGDGEWWTHVVPACEVAPGPLPAWPDWQCDGAAGPISAHPWDVVGCFEGQSTSCIGAAQGDSMLVWSTCHIDQFTSIPQPSCPDARPTAGQVWGPCPIDQASGQPTLCFGEDLACVPADFGEANICLPLDDCPAELPDFGTAFDLGWGNACYPRCASDADCGDGMVCGRAVADGTSMCAWPRR